MALFEVNDIGEVVLLADDAALPDGAYTTFRTYAARRVLRLADHVARLSASAGLQGRPGDLKQARLRRGLGLALAATRHAETRVRATFAPPRLFLELAPYEPLADSAYAHGVACATLPHRRRNPHAKDTRFIAAAAEWRARLPAGVHEGLLVDEADDAVLEGLSSNFFAVVDGELRTESERALLGVTRGIVLELSQGLLPARLEAVTRARLATASEAFLTSASRGVLPVVTIDGRRICDGRPGPVARALRRAFDALVSTEAAAVEPA